MPAPEDVYLKIVADLGEGTQDGLPGEVLSDVLDRCGELCENDVGCIGNILLVPMSS